MDDASLTLATQVVGKSSGNRGGATPAGGDGHGEDDLRHADAGHEARARVDVNVREDEECHVHDHAQTHGREQLLKATAYD